MAVGQITITQYDGNIQYCRVYNGAAFTNNDAEATSIGGTPFTLWTDSNDYVYVGADATFAYVGFRVATAGVGYGTFTFEYWNGAWTALTALFNNTSSFSVSGYLAWSVPGDWAATTVDTKSAYWIRASQSAVAPGTAATAYHLLRNLTLTEPLHNYGPEFEYDTVYPDINGALHKKDMTYKGPSKLTVGITQIACTYANFQLLQDWKLYRNSLYTSDLAVTSPIDLTADSYYRIMEGYLVYVPPEMMAAGKMPLDPGAYYPLVFKIDTIVTQTSLLGKAL